MSYLQALLLKLGMSVLKLQIDPKKLQEEKKMPQKEIKNHFEAARTRRSEQKDTENDRKKPIRHFEQLNRTEL